MIRPTTFEDMDFPLFGEYDSFELDLMELEAVSVDTTFLPTEAPVAAILVGAGICSVATSPLPSVNNATVDDSPSYNGGSWSAETSEQLDFGGIFSESPLVSASNYERHFFRNVNVSNLSDDLVHRLRVFHERHIASTTSMSALKLVLEDVCLDKKKLVPMLALISEPSVKTAAQLKAELMAKQTSESRELLMSLVINHAMSMMQETDSELYESYCCQLQLMREFSDLWGEEVPSEQDICFLTKCMCAIKIVQHQLQLDCNTGLSKKGLVITAAVMIADADRTYTNGGSQSKCIKILEDMFHRVTGYTVKTRGIRRSFDDMSA